MDAAVILGDNQTVSIAEVISQLHQSIKLWDYALGNITAAQAVLRRQDSHFSVAVCTIIVLNMQLGYTLIEVGFSRVKNVVGVLFKKMIEFCLCCVGYFTVGYSFAYGSNACNTIFGFSHFFGTMMTENDYPRWIFHFALVAKTVAIISTAVLERSDIRGFAVITLMLSGFTFPCLHHWMWNTAPERCKGWLFRLGFLDIGGSTVIHVAAGSAALVASCVVGSRKIAKRRGSKTEPDLPPPPPHNVPFIALGVLFLLLSSMGQAVGCAFHNDSRVDSRLSTASQVNLVVANNVIGFVFGMLIGVFLYRFFTERQRFDLPLSMMSGLAGAVSIQAGASLLDPWAAAIIAGPAAYFSYFVGQRVSEKKMDDPANVIGVNLGGGIWGITAMWLLMRDDGLLIHWKTVALRRLGWNVFGTIMTFVWCSLSTGLVLYLMRLMGWAKIADEVEEDGFDTLKHVTTAYPQFVLSVSEDFLTPGTEVIAGFRASSVCGLDWPSPASYTRGGPAPMTTGRCRLRVAHDLLPNTPRPSPVIIPQDSERTLSIISTGSLKV